MRVRSPLAVLAGAGILVALAVRPLVHGVGAGTAALFWATVLGEVVIPGVVLCRGARLCARDDAWLTLGQGATLGLAIQGLALLAGRALAAPWLAATAAAAATVLGLALDRRPLSRAAPPARAPFAPASTLAVALAAVLIQPLASAGHAGEPVDFDLLFHAGNAAELRHRWPLEDPRVAGVPLTYHLLAYALPVEAADRAGAAVADPLLGLAPLLWVILLVIQTANGGRVLVGDGRAGAIGAALLALHADPGPVLGLGRGAFNSHLATGVYGSPTTVCGLILLAGLAIALAGWVEEGGVRHLATLAVLGAAASAAKTTVLPVVLGGVALAAARALVARRVPELRLWAGAFAAMAAAGAPLTLWQRGGAEGYTGIVQWGPGAAFSASPFAAAVARQFGPQGVTGWTAIPAFLAWLTGYLGLAGVAAALYFGRRREPLSPFQAWSLGAAAAGGAGGLLLDVPGLSQLFFLYTGQVLVCLFGGAGLASRLRRPRSAVEAALGVLLAGAAVPLVWGAASAIGDQLRADAASRRWEPTPVLRDYREGLAWLRAHAARDAVVFADNPSLLLSAIGEVRLYYENGTYTARAWHVGPSGDPWPERTAVQVSLLRRPGAASLAEARRAVGPGPRILLVADRVPSQTVAGIVFASPAALPSWRFFPEDLFERRFANGAMQVYEARPQPPAPTLGPG